MSDVTKKNTIGVITSPAEMKLIHYTDVSPESIEKIAEAVAKKLAQPEQKWIPCSEKLPKENGSYLVTIHPSYIVPTGLHTDMLFWFEGQWWFDMDGENEVFPDPIIAWMPLPEPYRGDSDETD